MRISVLPSLLPALLFAAAGTGVSLEPVIVNPDGAWCWFQDERALIYGNRLSVGSVSSAGDVQIATWDFRKGVVGIATLHPKFERDDHDTPGLLLRHDGRLMAFYTYHRGPRSAPVMFCRVTRRPYDASNWDPAYSFDAQVKNGFSYANPFELSAERNRIYLFWRGLDYNPTWSSSDDGGKTWRPGANHIYSAAGERPYVKYASNGRDTIHFAFTDGHPNRPFLNSLYHAFYRNGRLYRSDGTPIRRLDEGPVRTTETTRIYDGTALTGEAWVWDLHLDRDGRPVIVYSSHPSPLDHRYRYARWNGRAWEDRQIAFAGQRLYEREAYYSGGICLDPDDIATVYLSSDVDIETGRPNHSGHYEIYRGVTPDRGSTWRWEALTRNSTQDNLRPIVPANRPGKLFVLWYRGRYTAYTDFKTEVVALTDAPLPAVTQRLDWDKKTTE